MMLWDIFDLLWFLDYLQKEEDTEKGLTRAESVNEE